MTGNRLAGIYRMAAASSSAQVRPMLLVLRGKEEPSEAAECHKWRGSNALKHASKIDNAINANKAGPSVKSAARAHKSAPPVQSREIGRLSQTSSRQPDTFFPARADQWRRAAWPGCSCRWSEVRQSENYWR